MCGRHSSGQALASLRGRVEIREDRRRPEALLGAVEGENVSYTTPEIVNSTTGPFARVTAAMKFSPLVAI